MQFGQQPSPSQLINRTHTWALIALILFGRFNATTVTKGNEWYDIDTCENWASNGCGGIVISEGARRTLLFVFHSNSLVRLLPHGIYRYVPAFILCMVGTYHTMNGMTYLHHYHAYPKRLEHALPVCHPVVIVFHSPSCEIIGDRCWLTLSGCYVCRLCSCVLLNHTACPVEYLLRTSFKLLLIMVFYECMMTAKNTARELSLLSSWCWNVLHSSGLVRHQQVS